MALAILYSRARDGVDAPLVTVEAHLANGLPAFSIVGLPEMTVRESRDRVRGAILNSRFEFPARRITINLAPADLRKEGPASICPLPWASSPPPARFPCRSAKVSSLPASWPCPESCAPSTGRCPWPWPAKTRTAP